MNTFLTLLYGLTGANTAPVAARRIIGMIIGAIFMVYVGIRGTIFLKDFADKAARTVEVQEMTLKQLNEMKVNVTELQRTTATKGDIKMIEGKIDEVKDEQERLKIEARSNRKQFEYFFEHYEKDSSEEIKDGLDMIRELLLNQKLESIPPNLTTYRNEQ